MTWQAWTGAHHAPDVTTAQRPTSPTDCLGEKYPGRCDLNTAYLVWNEELPRFVRNHPKRQGGALGRLPAAEVRLLLSANRDDHIPKMLTPRPWSVVTQLVPSTHQCTRLSTLTLLSHLPLARNKSLVPHAPWRVSIMRRSATLGMEVAPVPRPGRRREPPMEMNRPSLSQRWHGLALFAVKPYRTQPPRGLPSSVGESAPVPRWRPQRLIRRPNSQ